MSLNPKQERFVLEYMRDLNATQAAIRAGYSKKSADVNGPRLLGNAGVAQEIAKRIAKTTNKLEVTVERVLQERARLAFFDVRKLFDKDGQPIPLPDLDDDTAAVIAGLDVEETFERRGKGKGKARVGSVLKYRLADKNASLTALEKHLGMYKDGSEGAGPLTIHLHL